MVRRFTIALVLATALLPRAAASEELESPRSPGRPGDADATGDAPVEWTDPLGRKVKLDDYRGRILVLNFWATWCAPCRKELPDLARIQKEYAVFGVQVVGAAADPPEQHERVLEFARRHRVNFPVLLGATTDQMEALGLGVALPATAVIDADGKVVERTTGLIDRRDLSTTLDRLIGGDEVGAAGAAPPERSPGDAGHEHVEGKGHVHVHGPTQASLVPS